MCSMLTTLEMTFSLSSGTCSHESNASNICPLISLPGTEYMCVKGSRRACLGVSKWDLTDSSDGNSRIHWPLSKCRTRPG